MDWGYQHDSHVMAWWLWRTVRPIVEEITTRVLTFGECRYFMHPDGLVTFVDPEDWTRYDGELL